MRRLSLAFFLPFSICILGCNIGKPVDYEFFRDGLKVRLVGDMLIFSSPQVIPVSFPHTLTVFLKKGEGKEAYLSATVIMKNGKSNVPIKFQDTGGIEISIPDTIGSFSDYVFYYIDADGKHVIAKGE